MRKIWSISARGELPEATGIASIKQNQLCGYGIIRRCLRGYKIGPLFSDTPEIAESIFLHLSSSVDTDSPFFLDIPEVNPAAIELVDKHQMKKVFETARMYTQKQPSLAVNRLFGVTTFELG